MTIAAASGGASWSRVRNSTKMVRPVNMSARMSLTILLTGFGPFPGAPFNPTGPLVRELARRRQPRLAGARRVVHVFRTSYEDVDRELPMLLARDKPDVLVMFGLAPRSRHLRIETRARNALTRMVPDADGARPAAAVIAPGAPATLPLRTPVQRLVAAARSAGVPAARSSDAGRYLCNYLCWRASEASAAASAPSVVAFVHVPRVARANPLRKLLRRPQVTFDDLIRAGEAIVLAAARMRR